MSQRRSAVGLGLATAMLLAACATPEQQAAEARRIAVLDDRFRPHKEYTTGAINTADAKWRTNHVLLARVDRASGALRLALQLQIAYVDRLYRHYETARNERAEALPVRPINREHFRCGLRQGCAHAELIEIELAEAALRQALPQGITVKVFPRIGPEGIVTLPGLVVASLLARVDADRGPPALAGNSPRKPER